MTKKSGLTLLLVAATVMAYAQNLTIPASPNTFNGDGICYYLPKTQVMAKATATLTTQKPGPFYKYSERYLGITDVITEEKSAWTLETIQMYTQATIDSTKYFKVVLKPKTGIKAIQLTPNGLLAAVNTQAEPSPSTPAEPLQNNTPQEIKFDLTQLNEEALMANSIPKMAEIAAKQIYAIRESRTNLLSGDNTALPDGKALEIMLNELKKNEQELMALFVGKTTTHAASRTYTYTPTDAINNFVMLRFSTRNGLVDANDMVGSPIYLSIEPNTITPYTDKADKKMTVGLYYNKAGSAKVSLYDSKTTFATHNLLMAQFGFIESLPAPLFEGQQPKITFNPNSGELISISY